MLIDWFSVCHTDTDSETSYFAFGETLIMREDGWLMIEEIVDLEHLKLCTEAMISIGGHLSDVYNADILVDNVAFLVSDFLLNTD